MRARIRGCLLLVLLVLPAAARTQVGARAVLVYTRNFTSDGKGYVHDNIAASVAAIRKMGDDGGFSVDVSDDPSTFSDTNLKRYAVLVFANSNNEAFATASQKEAFRHFIQAGGGFVGIHSASGSQRDWPYFWSVLGGTFAAHPSVQSFTVRVVDSSHVATQGIPSEFDWTDECYFLDHLNPGIHPVLVTDRRALRGLDAMKIDVERFPDPMPLAWWQTFDGGREFYVALGHDKAAYANPTLYRVIQNGIVWAMSR